MKRVNRQIVFLSGDGTSVPYYAGLKPRLLRGSERIR